MWKRMKKMMTGIKFQDVLLSEISMMIIQNSSMWSKIGKNRRMIVDKEIRVKTC